MGKFLINHKKNILQRQKRTKKIWFHTFDWLGWLLNYDWGYKDSKPKANLGLLCIFVFVSTLFRDKQKALRHQKKIWLNGFIIFVYQWTICHQILKHKVWIWNILNWCMIQKCCTKEWRNLMVKWGGLKILFFGFKLKFSYQF